MGPTAHKSQGTLPVNDIVVLPAQHYCLNNGELIEIGAEEILESMRERHMDEAALRMTFQQVEHAFDTPIVFDCHHRVWNGLVLEEVEEG